MDFNARNIYSQKVNTKTIITHTKLNLSASSGISVRMPFCIIHSALFLIVLLYASLPLGCGNICSSICLTAAYTLLHANHSVKSNVKKSLSTTTVLYFGSLFWPIACKCSEPEPNDFTCYGAKHNPIKPPTYLSLLHKPKTTGFRRASLVSSFVDKHCQTTSISDILTQQTLYLFNNNLIDHTWLPEASLFGAYKTRLCKTKYPPALNTN